jgi:hypothetical protein
MRSSVGRVVGLGCYLLSWALLATACSDPGGDGPPPDEAPGPSEVPEADAAVAPPVPAHEVDASSVAPAEDGESPALFDAQHVLEVAIELDPADWDALRYEGRTVSQVFSGCGAAYEYTSFVATVTVDGERAEQVSIRKKGYLGSLSAQRPSLKLDFDDQLPEQRVLGTKRMTLNNDKQDPGHTHQCVSYRAFARAGVPAPRCNLARVSVNGRELGVYSHVEDIKKPLLRRELVDDSGRLFEGQGSDFTPGLLERFEFKNDGEPDDRSGLQAVADALLAPDDALLTRLDAVLPLDAFYDFWAMESLLGHWDGYDGDTNNFYVYELPGEGVHFIPWGTDGAFSREHPFLPDSIPQSVLALARVPNRLIAHPDGHSRYVRTLQGLLDTVWDEAALIAEVDAVEAQLAGDADATALTAMRAFVRGRRAELQAELDAGGPDWRVPPRQAPTCADRSTEITASFDTTWGELAQPTLAAGNAFDVSLGGNPATFDAVVARAGTFREAGKPSQPALRVIGTLADGSVVLAQISFGLAPFVAGTTPLHGTETIGFVGQGTPPDVIAVGLIGDGSITLDAASTTTDGAVRGHFEARVVPFRANALP